MSFKLYRITEMLEYVAIISFFIPSLTELFSDNFMTWIHQYLFEYKNKNDLLLCDRHGN